MMKLQSESQQEYKDKSKAKIDEFNAKVDELKVKINQSSSSGPMESHSKMQPLYIKRDLVEAKLEELENATPEDWERVKTEFERAWKDLSNTFETTVAKFD